MNLEALVAAIQQAPRHHRVKLVGIDGRAGSGKTTLAFRLGDALPAPVIQLDDFMAVTDIEGWWPRFETQLLQPLLRGEDARFQMRDWEGDTYGTSFRDWKTQVWAPLFVVEGVGATRRAISPYLSLSIWVETPADLCFARGIERDAGLPDIEGVWTRWQAMERAFFARDGTRDRATVVIPGTA